MQYAVCISTRLQIVITVCCFLFSPVLHPQNPRLKLDSKPRRVVHLSVSTVVALPSGKPWSSIMQASAKTELATLVKDHLTSLVREAICVQRHAKRARYHQTSQDDGVIRQRIHAEDVNLALQWRGSDVLYATGTVVPTTNDSKKKVDLNAYLKSEMQDVPPSEIGLTMHWLAVDGIQPYIPQNPSQADSIVHRVEDDHEVLSQYQERQQGVMVRQLLPRLLSEELQLYFTRITLALEKGGASAADRQQQDDALARVARDSGLQELVPFFVQYLAKQLHLHVGHPEHCRTLIRLARSLLINPYVHLELHVSIHEVRTLTTREYSLTYQLLASSIDATYHDKRGG